MRQECFEGVLTPDLELDKYVRAARDESEQSDSNRKSPDRPLENSRAFLSR